MKIKRLNDKAILPHYATEGSSAFDLFCYEDVEWDRDYTALIDTGWAFEIPKEHGMFILSRSGHGFKALTTLVNSVGLLDYDYRGSCMIKLICHDMNPPTIKAGTAIAQAVILHTPKQYFNVVDELTDTQRGAGGFGSTGI